MVQPDTPFCIAVLGDFRGTTARADAGERVPLRERQAIPFDRDDLDDAVARIRPVLTWSSAGAPSETLRFTTMEHFHPDSLYERVGVFGALRDLRRRLLDPKSAAAAASGMGRSAAESARPVSASGLTSGASLLDSMLDAATGESSPGATAARREDELAAFLRRVVAPHLVAAPDPRQAQLLAAADAAVNEQMRTLLHDPVFQALESNWRTLEFLARRIETGTEIRLYLIDIARGELDEDLDRGGEARASALYALLQRAAAALPNGGRWSVLAGLYTFGDDPTDATRLSRLGRTARALGAPWISAAAPALVGSASFASLLDYDELKPPQSPDWEALRASAEARWLGLAAPRLLLRELYGEDGEMVEAFSFEEDGGPATPYLWGNPAAACALLLAEAFEDAGWLMRPGAHTEISGLPLHLYRRDGETFSLPCAETLLTEDLADQMLELGIMPLASIRDTDTVRLLRFQSLAAPLAALAGPWAGGA
jgi:type VI secretion system protein ImpC